MLKLNRLTTQQLKEVFLYGKESSFIKVKSRRSILQLISSPTTLSSKRVDQNRLRFCAVNSFHTGFATKKKKDSAEEFDNKKALIYYPEFNRWEKKNKKTFLETVRVYKKNVKNRASHVDFIKAALKHMKEYGVHRDLESYKKLLDVLPKGVYICTNKLMADGMYYPRQQFVVLELLGQMSINSVIPDVELGLIIKNIFGSLSHPYKKYENYLYWSVKMKNRSPFMLPSFLPSNALDLAVLAIKRITSVDLQTEISQFQAELVEESLDKTWIVSGQSPKQKKLLAKHQKDVPVIVEGGDVVHLNDKFIHYFVLKADIQPPPFTPPEDVADISNVKSKFFNPYEVIKDPISVHEQDDGIIYGVCATGTSSRDSLLSWVRILERTGNPILAQVPVLFRFKQREHLPAVFSEEIVTNVEQDINK